MRLSFALLTALTAVLLSAPVELVPWGAAVRSALVGGHPWAAHLLVSGLLAVAAWMLPQVAVTATTRWRGGLLGVGLLLLEPWLHLGLLGWLAWRPPPGSAGLVLPDAPPQLFNGAMWRQVLILALAAPLAEEWFFRGRLAPWLAARVGTWSAVSISALAFAVAHGDPRQVVIALPVGVLLGALRLSGHGLGACVLVHVVHNLLFIVAGAALLSVPWVAVLLALTGVIACWLALLTAAPRVWSCRRAHLAAAAMVALIAAFFPLFRVVQDQLWATAAARVVVGTQMADATMVLRLERQRRAGRLAGARGARLLKQARAWSVTANMPRLLWAQAVCAPQSFADAGQFADVELLGLDALTELAACPVAVPAVGEALRACARHNRAAVALCLASEPVFAARWLPLPRESAWARELLIASAPQPRRRLLATLEHVAPGRVADLLLGLPPDAVTAMDRRHLFLHYDDAQERLERAPLAVAAAFRAR